MWEFPSIISLLLFINLHIPFQSKSGLFKTKKILDKVKEIKMIEFDHKDVVRHPLVTMIIKAFNK